MKKYIQPMIKAIKLDPEQSVLEVCRVGGGYMDGTACLPRGSMVAPCSIQVRGANETCDPLFGSRSASPS